MVWLAQMPQTLKVGDLSHVTTIQVVPSIPVPNTPHSPEPAERREKPSANGDEMALSLQKYPITDDIQTWLLKELWLTPATSPQASSLGMLPYFNYYSTLCQLSFRNGGVYISAKSH